MGLDEFNDLPFGLWTKFFQRIMDQVLSGLEDCKENLVNDMLVFSPDVKPHRRALCEVFQRLRKHNLTFRERK